MTQAIDPNHYHLLPQHRLAHELAELQHAYAHGRGGYAEPLTALVNQPLLFLTVPEYCARGWTVTLNAMRYQSGPIPNSTIVMGPGLDRAADLNVFPTKVLAALEYGVGGAAETALIDYPAQGCSFSFFAATLKVTILSPPFLGPPANTPPIVGGFVTPQSAAPRFPGEGPRFSYSVIVPAQQEFDYAIPRRARGYYFYALDESAYSSNQLYIDERIGKNGTIVKIDFADAAVANTLLTVTNGAGGTPYVPLDPLAQVLHIRNDDVVDLHIGLSFVLDL